MQIILHIYRVLWEQDIYYFHFCVCWQQFLIIAFSNLKKAKVLTLSSSSIMFPFLSSLYCKTEWKNCLYVSSHLCLFYSSIYNNQAFSSLLRWNCFYQLHNPFTKSNPMANSKPLRYWTFSGILYSSSLLSSCINFTWLWNTFYSCLPMPSPLLASDLLYL